MISVLIPTYNCNIVPLVTEIRNQFLPLNVSYEILAFDDASMPRFNDNNDSINLVENCRFKLLLTNIGRSAIRNLLAKNAKYENLLFIDAGTFPKEENFISQYLGFIDKKIVVGGMTSSEKSPKKPYKLRWLYTKKRESVSKNNKVICSSNFFIKKTILLENPFDESIKKYGCEDVVFFNSLLKKNIEILHIANPVIHDSDDDANTFIIKTEYAIENLIELISLGKLSSKNYNVSIIYDKLKKIKLDRFAGWLFNRLKPHLVRNFNTSNPSLLLFDFYRLGYFCQLKNKK